jgi:multidrug efflux pump subunit AcrA (membrane-fusion protein)
MKVTLPKDSPLVGGMKAKVKLITYRNEKALTIPKNAVKTDGDKSTVRLKMADGKDEVRRVKLGKTWGDRVEILEGIAADQVILLPASE